MLKHLTSPAVAAAAALCIAGCAHHPKTPEQRAQAWADAVQHDLESITKGSANQQDALDAAAQIRTEVRAFYDQLRQDETTLFQLNADYNATRDQFQQVFDTMAIQRNQTYERLLQLHTRLRNDLTPTEWQQLVKSESQEVLR